MIRTNEINGVLDENLKNWRYNFHKLFELQNKHYS